MFFLKCSLSLAIREMRIKTTLIFHLYPSQSGKDQQNSQQQNWRGWGKKGPHLLLAECKMVQPHLVSCKKESKNKNPLNLPCDHSLAYAQMTSYPTPQILARPESWVLYSHSVGNGNNRNVLQLTNG